MAESTQLDVLVLGGSIPGAVVALECARLGLSVAIQGQLPTSVSSELENTQGGVTWLLETLSETGSLTERVELQPVAPRRPMLLGVGRQIVPQPAESIFGIPSSPLAADVSAAVGRGASLRAYLDRLKPVLTIGKEHNLEHLVVQRMGKAVLDTLVTPLVVEHFGAMPEDVDVSVAVPGLNEALTRTGSLSTAVLASLDGFRQRTARFRFEDEGRAFLSALKQALNFWNVRMLAAPDNAQPTDSAAQDELEALMRSARATVIAGTEDDARRSIPREVAEGMVIPHREYSDWRIEHSSNGALDVEPLASLLPVGFVTVLHDSNGSPVSFRVLEAEASTLIVRVSEPRTILPPSAGTSPEHSKTYFVQVLDSVTGKDSSALTSQVDMMRVRHSIECAPRIRSAEIHIQNSILATFDERADGAVVGEWLHEGNLSDAIVHAKHVAQSLRRSLLGIT